MLIVHTPCYIGADFVDSSSPKMEFPIIDVSSDSEKPLTRAQKKNIRKKQKKKDTKYAFEIEEIITNMEDVAIETKSDFIPVSEVTIETKSNSVPVSEAQESDRSIDINKKIRTLRKKLKQIEELEEKLDGGEFKPNKEQIAKISKKKDFLEEIEALSAL